MDPVILVALITTLGGVIVALIGFWGKVTEIRDHTKEAKEQVKNSHTTNLRDDMDAIHEDVRAALELLKQHSKEIGGIREDIRQERDERLVLSKRLDAHLTHLI